MKKGLFQNETDPSFANFNDKLTRIATAKVMVNFFLKAMQATSLSKQR